MMISNKKWIDFLPEDVYQRLANCNSVKSDIPALEDAKWRGYRELGKDKCGFTKEDALISVLELLDCNSCDIELTSDEYQEMKR